MLKVLGRGGSGTVYLVADTNLHKKWAMKVVRKADFPGGGKALFTEMELLAKLSHPRLPRIVDAVETKEELAVVMDYIEGRTLAEVVETEGVQEPGTVAAWGLSLAEVLVYLHSRQPPVIYRDMKPANVMLQPNGEVILFDLGIARERREEGGSTVSLGTYGYAAPEQLDGTNECDARTDLYSLGMTMYHLLTGKKPWENLHRLPDLSEIAPSVPAELAGIIEKCTRTDKECRYESAAALASALRHFLSRKAETKHGTAAGAPPLPDRTRSRIEKWWRKEKRKVVIGAAAFFTGVAGFAFAASGRAEARRELNRNYQRILMEADAIAERGAADGLYLREATEKYTEAADLMPGNEEAYMRILDYCLEMGKTRTGLQIVCSRIDSGEGGIDRSPELLFRVAQIWFCGNASDETFSPDYRKAARYFAMVDRRHFPESVYYASLAQAMSSTGGPSDWKHIAEMLLRFEEYNEGLPSRESRIRNRQMAAGIYTVNRYALEAVGTDAYGAAVRLLEAALRDLEKADAEETGALLPESDLKERAAMRQRIFMNLGAAYAAKAARDLDPDSCEKAAACYEELLAMTAEEEEKTGKTESDTGEIRVRLENVRKLEEQIRKEGDRAYER